MLSGVTLIICNKTHGNGKCWRLFHESVAFISSALHFFPGDVPQHPARTEFQHYSLHNTQNVASRMEETIVCCPKVALKLYSPICSHDIGLCLLSPIVCAISSASLKMNTEPLSWLVAILLGLLISSCIRTYLRLRHIPGPPGVGFSKLWLLKKSFGGRFHLDTLELCENYGTRLSMASRMVHQLI